MVAFLHLVSFALTPSDWFIMKLYLCQALLTSTACLQVTVWLRGCKKQQQKTQQTHTHTHTHTQQQQKEREKEKRIPSSTNLCCIHCGKIPCPGGCLPYQLLPHKGWQWQNLSRKERLWSELTAISCTIEVKKRRLFNTSIQCSSYLTHQSDPHDPLGDNMTKVKRHAWLCMKWHCAWLYGVHRMRQDSSSFMWHQQTHYKKLVISVESHVSAASLLKSREWRYIKVINNNNVHSAKPSTHNWNSLRLEADTGLHPDVFVWILSCVLCRVFHANFHPLPKQQTTTMQRSILKVN